MYRWIKYHSKDKKEIWIPFHEGSVTRFNLDYHQYVKNARELKDKILKYIIKHKNKLKVNNILT